MEWLLLALAIGVVAGLAALGWGFNYRGDPFRECAPCACHRCERARWIDDLRNALLPGAAWVALLLLAGTVGRHLLFG